MSKKSKKRYNFNEILENFFNKIFLRENGSLDLFQILIFCLYIFICSKVTKLTEKNEKINIPYNLNNFHWTPRGDKIKTKWGINLDINNVWKEYPRPQLQRKEWINLNGPWLYSITEMSSPKPKKADGIILVPFPIESSLSGVMKDFKDNQTIWYEKDIEIPQNWTNKNILLHFGGVDWKCKIYINDIYVGTHSGGYSPFYFDITDKLKKGLNKLIVKVIDPSNKGYQPRGKQILIPTNTYYTAISGIWQTVWLEPVYKDYIKNVEINNDFDNKEIKINFNLNSNKQLSIKLSLEYNGQKIKFVKGLSNNNIIIFFFLYEH